MAVTKVAIFNDKENSMLRRKALILSTLTVAVLAAGCGGGDDGPGLDLRPDVVQLAQSNADLSILVEALTAAGLVDTLKGTGPFTVFAPNNAAFAALLTELGVTKAQLLADKALLTAVLTYHVIPSKVEKAQIPLGKAITTVQGSVLKIEANNGVPTITDGRNRTSRIIATDLQARNGVVHVIDRVLLPPNKTIVETAQSLAAFSILVEAVVAADLQATLSGKGPFTVFAPTNEAFAKLPAGTVENLLKPENKDTLVKILTCHVVGKAVMAEALVGMIKADGGSHPVPTLGGCTLQASLDGDMVKLTDEAGDVATVTIADVVQSNGVIHVIDTVMLPKM